MVFDGPSHVERVFNSLFYASLGLSIANVTLGLLCLQWIRGMSHEPPGVSRQYYCRLRYARYLGFERWGAKTIITALPLLLLGSLLSFVAGLLAFASSADWISSIPLYIILPCVFAIVLFTTFAPGLVIVLNSIYRKGYQFPPIPPFRSLQSWIAMQAFIQFFRGINRIFKANPFNAFLTLQRCPDWSQVDMIMTNWSNFAGGIDVLRFPVVLSTGTTEEMNVVSRICEEYFSWREQPKLRKLRVLSFLARRFGKALPATTVGMISELWINEVVALINVGTPLAYYWFSFDIEENIIMDSVATGKRLISF